MWERRGKERLALRCADKEAKLDREMEATCINVRSRRAGI